MSVAESECSENPLKNKASNASGVASFNPCFSGSASRTTLEIRKRIEQAGITIHPTEDRRVANQAEKISTNTLDETNQMFEEEKT